VPDEPQGATRPGRYQFTDEEIERFLAEKWMLEECEVCRQATVWGYFRPRPLLLITTSDGGNDTITGSLSFLRLSCNNCGNSKFFDAEVIKRWLDANPK